MSRKIIIVSVVTSVCAGLGMMAWQSLRPHPPPRQLPPPAPVEQNTPVARVDTNTALATIRDVHLLERIEALEARQSGSEPAESPPLPPAPTREEIEEGFAAAVRQHDDEAVGGAWADRATLELKADFGEVVAGTSAKVLDIDCRSTTCAVLPSFGFRRNLNSPGATKSRPGCCRVG
jgi:hypothetical protein